MATEPMKTLTLNGQTFEITDAQARATLQQIYAEDYADTTGGGAFIGIPKADTNNIQQIRQFVIDRLAYVDSQILS